MKAKVKIVICLGSSCHSRGNEKTLEVIKKYLKEKDLTDRVDLRGQLCSGNCKDGPVINIDEKLYKEVTEGSIVHILDEVFMQCTA